MVTCHRPTVSIRIHARQQAGHGQVQQEVRLYKADWQALFILLPPAEV
jgi:hypothetical protein